MKAAHAAPVFLLQPEPRRFGGEVAPAGVSVAGPERALGVDRLVRPLDPLGIEVARIDLPRQARQLQAGTPAWQRAQDLKAYINTRPKR